MPRPPLSYEAANALWSVLVEVARANEAEREWFVHEFCREVPAVPVWPVRTLSWGSTFRYDGVHPPIVEVPAAERELVEPGLLARVNAALLGAALCYSLVFDPRFA